MLSILMNHNVVKLRRISTETRTLFTTITILLCCTLSYAQPGALDLSFDPGTGADAGVFTISFQPDGKIIIGGQFTSYNGTARNHIARLNVDGSLDTSFDPGTGANSSVYSTSVQSDGKIIIGGPFTSYNGTARNYIARLNIDGSLDTSFDPGTGASSTVWATSIQSDGKVIIAGEFTSYNGTGRSRIARLNVNGSLDTSFDPGTGASYFIETFSMQGDGKIIIGGGFVSYNGTARNYIARLNVDGSLDTNFDPGTGASSTVKTISIQSDGKIIIGGNFGSFDGTARNYIARLNVDGSLDTSFDPGTGANAWVTTTSIQSDGKIIIAGYFYLYNGVAINQIARLNDDGNLDTSFDPGTGTVSAVATTSIQSDGKILVGGYFTSYNGTARNRIARLVITPVGIHQSANEMKKVTIFPNPFSNTCTLDIEVEMKNGALTVYNSIGQSVKQIENISGHTIILNRSNLPGGLYFIQLSEDNQIIMTDKLVITD